MVVVVELAAAPPTPGEGVFSDHRLLLQPPLCTFVVVGLEAGMLKVMGLV